MTKDLTMGMCVRLFFVIHSILRSTNARTHNWYMQSEAEEKACNRVVGMKKKAVEWASTNLIGCYHRMCCHIFILSPLTKSYILLSEKNPLQINLCSLNGGSTKAESASASTKELWRKIYTTHLFLVAAFQHSVRTHNLCMYIFTFWYIIRTCDMTTHKVAIQLTYFALI